MNDCVCKRCVFALVEFFNSCQIGINVSLCSGVMLEHNGTSAEYMSYVDSIVIPGLISVT